MATKVDVAPVEKTPAREAEPLTIIGKPLMKVDAMAKVAGETLFADDIALPRMAYCKILRSPHPHARVVKVDTRRVEAMEGVLATLVGSELPIPFGILPVSQDEHALCPDKARFAGDPVAAVAALDEETAERAIRLIDNNWKDDDGQTAPVHSISAGLDYPGVGPEHAWLKDAGRAEYVAVDDDEAMAAFHDLCRLEGIIPALESSHAVAQAKKLAPTLRRDQIILVNLSGRGDKDINTVARHSGLAL